MVLLITAVHLKVNTGARLLQTCLSEACADSAFWQYAEQTGRDQARAGLRAGLLPQLLG